MELWIGIILTLQCISNINIDSDKQRSEAVTNVFIKLFEEGIIYRDSKLVHWCPALQTVISDIEVDYLEIQKPTKMKFPSSKSYTTVGEIHNIAYKIVNDQDDELIVSTTRVETILGDVALAIHPNDQRYFKYHGKSVYNPLTGEIIPIILDELLVDPEFGTGIVKVTPAHDENDYACGKRFQLPIYQIFDSFGNISIPVHNLKGFDRFEARHKVIELLKEKGLYRGAKPHSMRIAVCSRSGDLIEPMLQPQWYLKCNEISGSILSDTNSDIIRIHPSSFVNNWKYWICNFIYYCSKYE